MALTFPHLRRWLSHAVQRPVDGIQATGGNTGARPRLDSNDLLMRYQRLHEAQQLAGLGHWHCDAPASPPVLCPICLGLIGLRCDLPPAGFSTLSRRIRRQDLRMLMDRIDRALHEGTRFEAEVRVRTADGSLRWVQILGCVVRGHDGTALRMHGTAADITRRRALQDQIHHLALHDGLTGLPNRIMFQHHFTHALLQARRYSKQLALLFIDLDHFKQVNDSLGHEAGDRVLQEVARRLGGSLRRGDLVARLGGDEFVVLLEEITSLGQVSQVARQIQAAMAPQYLIAGEPLTLAASIGISTFPDDGDDEASMLRHADAAMYDAKHKGRNRFQYYSALPE